MQKKISDKRIRFFLGDIRDEKVGYGIQECRLCYTCSCTKTCSTVRVQSFECIKTNVNGAQAIISAAIKTNVKKLLHSQQIKHVINKFVWCN